MGSDEQRHDEVHDAEGLSKWQSQLEQAVHGSWVFPGTCPLDRVMVLAETESTQDAAMRLCGGRPGLVVIAGRQTKGRGRLGRLWADTSHLGVAMTFVFDGKAYDDAHLSLAVGVAASKACGARASTVRTPVTSPSTMSGQPMQAWGWARASGSATSSPSNGSGMCAS